MPYLSAVVEVEDTFLVLALDRETDTGYEFKQLAVSVGITKDGHTEILTQLPKDQQFLTVGAFGLVE